MWENDDEQNENGVEGSGMPMMIIVRMMISIFIHTLL